MRLPVGKVEHEAQVVPGEDAGEAGAQLAGVGRRDVLVRPLVDAELRLAAGRREQRLHGRVDVAQRARRGEALREEGIATGDDGGAQHARVGGDDGVQAAAGAAHAEDVARRHECERLEQQLRGQLGEADDGRLLAGAPLRPPLHARRALRLEGQRRGAVLERLVVAAGAGFGVSRHRRWCVRGAPSLHTVRVLCRLNRQLRSGQGAGGVRGAPSSCASDWRALVSAANASHDAIHHC